MRSSSKGVGNLASGQGFGQLGAEGVHVAVGFCGATLRFVLHLLHSLHTHSGWRISESDLFLAKTLHYAPLPSLQHDHAMDRLPMALARAPNPGSATFFHK